MNLVSNLVLNSQPSLQPKRYVRKAQHTTDVGSNKSDNIPNSGIYIRTNAGSCICSARDHRADINVNGIGGGEDGQEGEGGEEDELHFGV